MRIKFSNIIMVLLMFVGSGLYFFSKSANNEKGLIINGIFVLGVNQANIFYFVMGCVCILILSLCGVAVYLQSKHPRQE